MYPRFARTKYFAIRFVVVEKICIFLLRNSIAISCEQNIKLSSHIFAIQLSFNPAD